MSLSKEQQALVADLFSSKDSVVIKAIHQLREIGDYQTLTPLFDLLVSTNSELVREEIVNLLNELKTQKALPVIIEAIKNPKYSPFIPELVGACWQSGLDCKQYLKDFVFICIQEDYITAIEAVTVIDTMLPPYNNQEINECLNHLEKAWMEADEIKEPLLKSLAQTLTDYRDNPVVEEE